MEDIFYLGTEWLKNDDYIYRMTDAVLFLFFFISVLYLFIFALYSLKKRKYEYPQARKKYRFAIIYPAYREDSVILNSVQLFLKQQYSRDLYDVIVISDQMTDETNKKLEALGALVVISQITPSTKTNALRTAIRYIECHEKKYDEIVILDADNLVDVDFLDKLNNAFYSGCSVIQTHRVAKNRNTSTAVLDAVSEEINNSIFRKGHTRLGFSSGLIGSGMAFDYELFKESIMVAKHIGVDKQLELILLKQNIYIEYLEDVYTYDEKVANKTSFYNQRRRWLATQFTNLFSGLGSMPFAMFNGNWDYCNKLFQWMMPPRILLLGMITIISCALTWFDWVIALKWWGLLLLLGITFSIAVPDHLVDSRFRKAVLTLPILFLLMFFNLFRLKGATKEFIHTEHTHK